MADAGLLEYVEDKEAPLNYQVKPAQRELPNLDDIELYKQRRVEGQPLRDYDVDVDMKSFPMCRANRDCKG